MDGDVAGDVDGVVVAAVDDAGVEIVGNFVVGGDTAVFAADDDLVSAAAVETATADFVADVDADANTVSADSSAPVPAAVVALAAESSDSHAVPSAAVDADSSSLPPSPPTVSIHSELAPDWTARDFPSHWQEKTDHYLL